MGSAALFAVLLLVGPRIRVGHWEQIGRDNADERARRAALPKWRQALRRHAEAALIAGAWVITGVIGLIVYRTW